MTPTGATTIEAATTGREGYWRVSAAVLARVVFDDPRGVRMLALERRATVIDLPEDKQHSQPVDVPVGVPVSVQPFGGAVRIRDAAALRGVTGELRFDSQRSREEQDFRILIRPAEWAAVTQFCLRHLARPDDPVLESDPRRELAEEFADAVQYSLSPDEYRCRPDGFVIENSPSGSDNIYARGMPTLRVYRIFEVQIVDRDLSARLLENSARFGPEDLRALARADAAQGGKGRANAVLTVPLEEAADVYLALPVDQRGAVVHIAGHSFSPSLAAVLPGVEMPQYERLEG